MWRHDVTSWAKNEVEDFAENSKQNKQKLSHSTVSHILFFASNKQLQLIS